MRSIDRLYFDVAFTGQQPHRIVHVRYVDGSTELVTDPSHMRMLVEYWNSQFRKSCPSQESMRTFRFKQHFKVKPRTFAT